MVSPDCSDGDDGRREHLLRGDGSFTVHDQVVSIFCNRIGKDVDDIVYLGRSAIFFPDGTEMSAAGDAEQLLVADVDMSYVVGYQEKFGLP
jgi:predicted amidohydrolase